MRVSVGPRVRSKSAHQVIVALVAKERARLVQPMRMAIDNSEHTALAMLVVPTPRYQLVLVRVKRLAVILRLKEPVGSFLSRNQGRLRLEDALSKADIDEVAESYLVVLVVPRVACWRIT